ncbi:MAG: 2-isopropylmalate synthase [Clostridia bacterium]|nr:2-isopropylmalate synthase [Clostridia bacterium]
MTGYEKYTPFVPQPIENRTWPDKTITKAPTWVSVDLRDGNQALIDPMSMDEKLAMFHLLVDEIGVKEVEIGFPSASDTDYEICRELIEGGHIPEDVTIQVLVQARPHLIRRTFEAIRGAKNVIFHFYNSTSTLQREVVFHTDVEGVKKIATDAADLIYEMAQDVDPEMNLRFEYSPESFMGTEMDVAAEICAAVLDHLHADEEHKVILNLPTTVENCLPNQFADELEYFLRRLPGRERAVISLHAHNDRGTGVATTEMGLLAGAERVEACLFGNGERTGNVDLITLAMNMYVQGVDPELDFSNMERIISLYERATKMQVPARQPYAGDLVFTAFSGSHQDAINKGFQYMEDQDGEQWMVPYLPINPEDLGRSYEPVRINSQSGKGGAAFIMHHKFGFDMPKAMHAEFGAVVQEESDREGVEIKPETLYRLFEDTYLKVDGPYRLIRNKLNANVENGVARSHFYGKLRHKDTVFEVEGDGNGPIDAFFNAIHEERMNRFTFIDYKEHAISQGSDSQAVAYVQLRMQDGRDVFGVGIDHNISMASIKAVICAINRGRQIEEAAEKAG